MATRPRSSSCPWGRDVPVRPPDDRARGQRADLSEVRQKRVRDRFGLGADITWKPKPPMKMPLHARVVLHELRKWADTGRPFENYRELGLACDMSTVDAKRACDFLDGKGLLNDRREPV